LAFALAFFFAAMCGFTPFLEKLILALRHHIKDYTRIFEKKVFSQKRIFSKNLLFFIKSERGESSPLKIKAFISSLLSSLLPFFYASVFEILSYQRRVVYKLSYFFLHREKNPR
jgi:hypothetical protein